MKYPTALITALSLGLLSTPALADPDPVTLSWVLPTQNTDGTTIPATGPDALATITLDYSSCLSGELSEPRLSKVVAGDVTTTQIQIFILGDWCFAAYATNNAGERSTDSNVATKTVVIATPEAPVLLTAVAAADSVTVTLTLPTQNTNGTPIPASGNESLNHLDIRYSICLNGGLDDQNQFEQSDVVETTRTISNLADGEWCFAAAVQNVGDPGTHSGLSNVLSATIGGSIPEPPVLTVVDTTVYSVSKGDNLFLLAAVGTVPMGTACDESQYVRGINENDKFHVVPVDKVDLWFGSVRSNVVVASCE